MSESSNFVYTGLKELEDTEKNLVRYNTFIVKTFLNHSNFSNKILDLGAGIGTLSNIWRKLDQKATITCLELDRKQLQILRDREFKTITTLDSTNKFEYIFSSNVLEHIEDDMGALNDIYRSLMKNGRLGIFVPANQILYSKLDEKLGHFRRYKKSEIVQKVEFSGFKVDSCHYVDCLGFFALAIAKLMSLNLANTDTEKVNFYGKVIWPIARLLDIAGAKYLFGKNLLLLASKN